MRHHHTAPVLSLVSWDGDPETKMWVNVAHLGAHLRKHQRERRWRSEREKTGAWHTWDSSGWQPRGDCALRLAVGPPEGRALQTHRLPSITMRGRCSRGHGPLVLPASPCVGRTHSSSQKEPTGRKWQLFAVSSHLCIEKWQMLRT